MSDTSPFKKPLDLKPGNPSRNSASHAATDIQSSVEPEDYPAEERDQQAAITADRPRQ